MLTHFKTNIWTTEYFSILAFFTKSNDYISTLGKVISQLEYYGLTKSE